MAVNPLKPICITGIILALIVSWGMVLFGLFWGRDIPAGASRPQSSFRQELKDYDLFDAPRRVLSGENPELIEKRLARLQKQSQGAEQQLSVLKRWRLLAQTDKRYQSGYEKAAREAAETFPGSAPLAAIAAETLVLTEAPLSGDAIARLKSYIPELSQYRFGNLQLSLHVLAGDLDSPGQAAAVPELPNLFSSDLPGISEKNKRDLRTDEFLLRAAGGDIPGASAALDALLSASGSGAGLQRMGAEFFYDHGNPMRAAEIFARLGGQYAESPAGAPFAPGEKDLAQAADALFLAGEIPGARNIWLALSSKPAGNVPAGDSPSPDIGSRSLYNLAATSDNEQDEKAWLEKLFTARSAGGNKTTADNTGVFSIIRYSRLMDTNRAIAVLDNEEMTQNSLLDLELLRRRIDTWPPTRAAAEVWLLLGRHPDTEALYEWAAWYFDHQKLYGESSRLLAEAARFAARSADRKAITGSWYKMHSALTLIRDGKIAEGEKILKEIGAGSTDWRIPANLGCIQESRRAISAALDYYQAAAALVSNQLPAEKSDAALVQMRLSRCLETLGRIDESRRALEYAQELDPANLDIRRELRRLNTR